MQRPRANATRGGIPTRSGQEVEHLPVPSGLLPPDEVVGSLKS